MYLFVFDSITDRYKTQEMCDKVVSEDLFMIACCPDKYKPKEYVIKRLMIL